MDGLGSDIWSAVADAFRKLRGRQAHDLWLAPARPVSLQRGLFTLEVKDAGAKVVLDERYRCDLEDLVREVTGSPVRVRTTVSGAADPAVPVDDPGPAAPLLPAEPGRVGRHGSFVVTAANRMAHLSAQRFLAAKGQGFNPLFIHGPAGSGKTALGACVLQQLQADEPDLDPLVLAGEAVSQDVARAARDGSFGRLQSRWGGRRLILLDEAHRLRNREATQAILVTLIAPALQRGGRVLILSRHAPHDVYALGEKLRSHFLSGFVVALGEPDAAAREAVLAGVAGELGLSVDPRLPGEVARRCPGNLGDAVTALRRAAEGATHGTLGLDALTDRLLAPSRGDLALANLVALVAEELGLPVSRIHSAEKARPVALARHLCAYLADRSLGLSTRQICRSLHKSSPSLVAYARRAVERQRARDGGFESLVQRLQLRLEGAQRELSWRG